MACGKFDLLDRYFNRLLAVPLVLILPSVDEGWLSAFSDRLFQQLDYYDMQAHWR